MTSEEKQSAAGWRVLKQVLKWGLVLLVLLVLLLIVCIVFRIPLPLELARPFIEDVAEESLGREVTLAGPLRLIIGRSPEFSVAQISIANPQGYAQKSFLVISRLEGKFDLVELLDRRIQIDDLKVDGVRLNLEQQADGANWEFDLPVAVPEESGAPPLSDGEQEATLLGIDRVMLTDAVVSYDDRVEDIQYRLDINNLALTAPAGQAVKADGEGAFQQESWTLGLESALLQQLLAPDAELPLRLDFSFLGSTVDIDLTLDRSSSPQRVDGSIDIDFIDPARWQALQQNSSDEPVDLVATLEPLKLVDTNVGIRLGELAGMPVSVTEAALGLHVEDGQLDMPLSGRVDNIPVESEVVVETGTDDVSMTASLSIESLDIENLVARYLPDEDVTGQASMIAATFSARGRYLSDAMRTIRLQLDSGPAALSFGNEGIKQRVELDIDELSLGLGPARPVEASVSGRLLGESISLVFSGPNVIQLLDEDSWRVEFSGNTAAIDLSGQGDVLAATESTGPSFSFQLGGDNFGGLSSWIGVTSQYLFKSEN